MPVDDLAPIATAALQQRGLRARLLLLVRDAMVSAAELRVPLEVSMGHGRDWLAAH